MTDQARGDKRIPADADAQPRDGAREANVEPRDAADDVPVPIVMSPAEVDERAQVIEALNAEEGGPPSPMERKGDR